MFDPSRLVPVAACLLLCYLNFGSLYALGYHTIWRHHARGPAIVLWTLVAVLDVLIMTYWGMLLYAGPGRAPQIGPFDLHAGGDVGGDGDGGTGALTPPPQYFLCDSQGFPYWCLHCQLIKLPRTFHLKHKGYCVLKFDHYCVWVGSPIGERNYAVFLKFVLWCLGLFVVILVFLAVYTPRGGADVGGGRNINKNFVFMYIFCGVFVVFLAALMGSNMYYIWGNMTTLDDISKRQAKRYARWRAGGRKPGRRPRVERGKRYISMAVPAAPPAGGEASRVIVQYPLSLHPYSFGFVNNWINLWLNGNLPKVRDYGPRKRRLFALSVLIFVVPYLDVVLQRRSPPAGSGVYEDYCDTHGPEMARWIEEKEKWRRPAYGAEEESE